MIAMGPVDFERLMLLCDDDPVEAKELLQLMLDSADGQLAEMTSALDNSELLEIKRAAHALRGAAANVGAREVAALAEEIECDVEAHPASIAARIDDVRNAIERLRVAASDLVRTISTN